MAGAGHIRTLLIAAVLAVGVSACATRPDSPAPAPVDDAVYRALGGQAGIEGIVDDLLDGLVEDERINFQSALANIVRLRGMLIFQVCSVSGGPATTTVYRWRKRTPAAASPRRNSTRWSRA